MVQLFGRYGGDLTGKNEVKFFVVCSNFVLVNVVVLAARQSFQNLNLQLCNRTFAGLIGFFLPGFQSISIFTIPGDIFVYIEKYPNVRDLVIIGLRLGSIMVKEK
jgi:hypothetical protein